MMTTTAPAADRAYFVERLLACYATEHRAATVTEQQDAHMAANALLEEADAAGVDLYAASPALQEQARQAYLATL